jgi:hypothetical protein
VPPPGAAFFYLNRPLAPCLGSWGQNSAGQERTAICAGEICDNRIDDDGDGDTDCGDADCAGSPACQAAVFSFVDTIGDDILPWALQTYFEGLAVGPDHILFRIDEPFGRTVAWCSENAAFYRDTYLAAATTGGTFFSGPWAKWRRAPLTGNVWTGPDFGGYANSFGADCFGPYSWCSEQFPFEPANCVVPDRVDFCEAVDTAFGFDCNVSTGLPWTVTIRTASSRQVACGF